MDWLPSVAGALVAVLIGYAAVGQQHRLYSEREFRAEPMARRRRAGYGAGVAVASAAAVAVALRPGHYDIGPGIAVAGFAAGLLILVSTDIERRRIPNALTYPMVLAAAALCWIWPGRSVADIWLGARVAAGVGVALLLAGIALGSALGVDATVFGVGDVKLIVVLGLILGFPAVLSAVAFGASAGIPSVVLIFAGKGRATFSYGPFLVLGGMIPLLWPANYV